MVYYTHFDSPIGPVFMASTPAGICSISPATSEEDFLAEIKGYGMPERDGNRLHDLKRDIRDYFRGNRMDFRKHRLDFPYGTEFQIKVWKKLLEIPYGETRTYKWLADQIGLPNGYRAVGGANGKNPIPIIIPCHRVINSDGSLGGYSGGVWIKEWLLKLEHGI